MTKIITQTREAGEERHKILTLEEMRESYRTQERETSERIPIQDFERIGGTMPSLGALADFYRKQEQILGPSLPDPFRYVIFTYHAPDTPKIFRDSSRKNIVEIAKLGSISRLPELKFDFAWIYNTHVDFPDKCEEFKKVKDKLELLFCRCPQYKERMARAEASGMKTRIVDCSGYDAISEIADSLIPGSGRLIWEKKQ